VRIVLGLVATVVAAIIVANGVIAVNHGYKRH
jgi:hypothetical protein